VPNRDHRLAGDMFASGRIVLRRAPRALAVPGSSVKTGTNGGAQAWVVANGKLSRRAVTAGLHDELRDLVEVQGGLREGEKVVISPIEGMTDGQPVQLARDAMPGTPVGGTAPASTSSQTNAGKR
jgi:multidrug efflux pump subunit AcrA (membrane-fusion protein)